MKKQKPVFCPPCFAFAFGNEGSECLFIQCGYSDGQVICILGDSSAYTRIQQLTHSS